MKLVRIILAGCPAIAILSVINIGYSYSGAHVDNKTGATDYVWGGKSA